MSLGENVVVGETEGELNGSKWCQSTPTCCRHAHLSTLLSLLLLTQAMHTGGIHFPKVPGEVSEIGNCLVNSGRVHVSIFSNPISFQGVKFVVFKIGISFVDNI